MATRNVRAAIFSRNESCMLCFFLRTYSETSLKPLQFRAKTQFPNKFLMGPESLVGFIGREIDRGQGAWVTDRQAIAIHPIGFVQRVPEYELNTVRAQQRYCMRQAAGLLLL